MKKYIVREIQESYHTVCIDDEVDIDDVVNYCNSHEKEFNNGVEAMNSILNSYKELHGFDFNIIAEDGGCTWDGLDIYDEIEMEY